MKKRIKDISKTKIPEVIWFGITNLDRRELIYLFRNIMCLHRFYTEQINQFPTEAERINAFPTNVWRSEIAATINGETPFVRYFIITILKFQKKMLTKLHDI